MHYFLYGLKVLLSSGYRRFILIPLAANCLLFIFMAVALFSLLPDTLQFLMTWIPSWLPFIEWVFYGISGMLFLIMYAMSFTVITNIFAAPFNGLLAEKIQRQAGLDIPEVPLTLVITRTVGREFKKLFYFITRGTLVAVCLFGLTFIPLVNLMVPILGFIWMAWCLSVQYLDYAADNCQQDFKQLRKDAKKPFISTFGFGSIVALLMMVPFVNIFIMPAAVAGATLLWIQKVYVADADFNAQDAYAKLEALAEDDIVLGVK
jgi:CysZ protein